VDRDLLVIASRRRINIGPAVTFGYIAGRHAAGATSYET
jgi:hypothetical protein